jgi:hypothetical protein
VGTFLVNYQSSDPVLLLVIFVPFLHTFWYIFHIFSFFRFLIKNKIGFFNFLFIIKKREKLKILNMYQNVKKNGTNITTNNTGSDD